MINFSLYMWKWLGWKLLLLCKIFSIEMLDWKQSHLNEKTLLILVYKCRSNPIITNTNSMKICLIKDSQDLADNPLTSRCSQHYKYQIHHSLDICYYVFFVNNLSCNFFQLANNNLRLWTKDYLVHTLGWFKMSTHSKWTSS